VNNEPTSNEPTSNRSASEPSSIDLDVVLREIEADARERRRSGVYPPGFEEELAELFDRFSPPAASGDLGALIDDAEEHGLIEPFIPIESQKPAGRFVKQGFAKALGWYHTWLTQEISQFAGASVRALRVTADRLAAIERRLGHADRHAALLAEVDFVSPSDGEVSIVLDHLGHLDGRTLVARGGDGRLVVGLLDRGCDAYGVEPDSALRARAEDRGIDLLPDDTDRHLAAVRSGTLAAVILIGPDVDATSVGSRLDLIDRAQRALDADGVLAIVTTRSQTYHRRQPIGSELGAAPPFGGATWRALLQRSGAASVHEFDVAGEMLLVVARRDNSTGSVGAS
jgi:hypothetical protein